MIKTQRERDKTWSETLKEEATLVISEFEWNCHCCSTVKHTRRRIMYERHDRQEGRQRHCMIKTRRKRDRTCIETFKEEAMLGERDSEGKGHCCSFTTHTKVC